MPNNVINELVFTGLDMRTREDLLSKLYNDDGEIDFEILVPSPNNIWKYSCNSKHEEVFRVTHLDWAKQNWGTKWNAYGQQMIFHTEDGMVIRFETAWTPPYGWLVAIFNTFKVSFQHNYLSQGTDKSYVGVFDYTQTNTEMGEPWKEVVNKDLQLHRHLHFLLWGVESFPDEKENSNDL